MVCATTTQASTVSMTKDDHRGSPEACEAETATPKTTERTPRSMTGHSTEKAMASRDREGAPPSIAERLIRAPSHAAHAAHAGAMNPSRKLLCAVTDAQYPVVIQLLMFPL
ncbi:hypothetical protein SAZ_38185 [Streptomyces noursei ZPM]|nr:hypothetical protein SAZ_38185 [Streptomyces noursei ZPM]EPY92905.1 hypothetical protein K530_50855 [Streptomyces noursei CCRC 11814]EXU89323.1 hypothetical protein P354_23575 [Streptomyces noursei PD-1]